VKVGHCYATAGTPPYIPVVEILEQEMANADSPERFIEQLGSTASEMARVLPRLRQLKPDLPSPAQLPADQERRYVHNILRDHLIGQASDPQLVILEDIHWADEATILLIEHIAAGSRGTPLALIATYRDARSEVPAHVERVLADLMRNRLAQVVSLKPMDRIEVAGMLRGLAGQEAPEDLVQAISAETDGNPFFVEEVFRNLADEGRLLDAEGRFRRELVIDDLDVPESVRLVLNRRLERLGAAARSALSAAAIGGRDFDFGMLRRCTDLGEEELVSALEEAEWAELVIPRRGAGRLSYTFAHELIRQTLVSSVSAVRRQQLHLRVGEALEAIHADNIDEHAAELANHYYQAGELAPAGKAARYLKVAGVQAIEASAYEEAIRHFEHAALLQKGDDMDAAENDYHLGLALRSVGHWDEALVRWGNALAIYEREGADEATGSTCRAIAQHLAWAARWADSLEFTNRGLAALGERVSADRCQLMGMVGTTYSLAGVRPSEAEEKLAGARDIARTVESDSLLGYVDYLATAHHYCWLRVREAIEVGVRGAEMLRRTGDPWNLASTLSFVQLSAVATGDLDLVESVDAELLPLSRRVGHFGAMMFSNRNRRMLNFLRRASLAGWQESVEADQETCANIKGGIFVPDTNTFDGLGRFWSGDWDAALRLFEMGAAGEPPGSLGGNWAFVPLARAYAGDQAGAIEALDARADTLPSGDGDITRSQWAAGLVAIEAFWFAGAHARAAALYPAALGAIERGVVIRPFDCRLVQSLAGLAAAAAGRADDADAHFAEAVRVATELPVGIEAPETRRLWAEALAHLDRAGDRDRAGELLAEARVAYEDLGMARHAEMTAGRIAELA
jgi:tetratricopeptide (TPR) repeat protein